MAKITRWADLHSQFEKLNENEQLSISIPEKDKKNLHQSMARFCFAKPFNFIARYSDPKDGYVMATLIKTGPLGRRRSSAKGK